jgi:hypothetical protein
MSDAGCEICKAIAALSQCQLCLPDCTACRAKEHTEDRSKILRCALCNPITAAGFFETCLCCRGSVQVRCGHCLKGFCLNCGASATWGCKYFCSDCRNDPLNGFFVKCTEGIKCPDYKSMFLKGSSETR